MIIKKAIIFFNFIFILTNCSFKEKGYEDYKPEDFYEVQGVITSVVPTQNPFDDSFNTNALWEYHLDKNSPLIGGEKNLNLMIFKGYPIVVLVHKDDIKVNFFARLGFANDSLHKVWLKEKSKNVLKPR